MRIAVLGLLLLPVTVLGYGQGVLGTRLQVSNPGPSTARKVTVKAKETGTDDTLIGDPTVSGAELIVWLGGAMSSTQTFSLSAGTSTTTGKPFWSGHAVDDFIYKDPDGENGPVVAARIRLARGTFLITAKISGKVGAVALVPPNPGSSGCATFHILDGDLYHLQFASGRITNGGTRLFRVSRPTIEGSCPINPTLTVTSTSSTSTTTTLVPGCGNGVIDPGEMCDGESFCTSTCGIALYACCATSFAPACLGGCTPIGMSCYLACGNNPVYVGSHAAWTGPCPDAPDSEYLGVGTCEADPIAPTTVCCPLRAGGCTTTPVTTTPDLQWAVLNCAFSEGSTASVIGTCVDNACVPTH